MSESGLDPGAYLRSLLPPVDPRAVSILELKVRAEFMLLMPLELKLALRQADEPVGDGFFRCWLCRRVLPAGATEEEVAAEFTSRFPDEELIDPEFLLCSECNSIITEDQKGSW